MRLVIHAGLPKAGSTSLQNLLETSRTDLLRAGVLVPEAGYRADPTAESGRTAGHDALSLLSRTPHRLERFISLILDQAARQGADTVLMSCENLTHPANLGDLPNLKRATGRLAARHRNLEVRFTLIDRDPESWLRSVYSERVLDGRTFEHRRFAAFSDAAMKSGLSLDHMKQAARAALDQTVSVTRPIDADPAAALADWAEMAGIGLDMKSLPRLRASPSEARIEEQRQQNAALGAALGRTLARDPRTGLRIVLSRLPGEGAGLRRAYRTLDALRYPIGGPE